MPAPAISSRWIDKRRAHWTRLEELVERGRRGLKGFAPSELQELALLYRQAAADLSTAREHPSSAQLAAYLNQLLGSAHNLIYTAPPARMAAVARFFAHGFPQVFRATWRYTAAATLVFLAGAVTGAALTVADPGFPRVVVGPELLDSIERGEMWTHAILSVKPVASSAILTNNISVSFAAFATGIFAGLGTAYMMLFNGIMLGVIAVACGQGGMGLPLWSFVAPHGALELPSIFMAGGAGLLLGRGVIAPGDLPRREALNQAAGTAVRLAIGVVPLLVVAGIVEGFVSPTGIPVVLKFATGAALFILMVVYLMFAGRVTEAPAP